MSALTVLRRTLVPLVVATLVLLSGVTPLTGDRDTAAAADLSQFDPGMIISDAVFYDTSTMNATQIQTFLNTKGASCSPTSGNTCLKSYRETTGSRAKDKDGYCAAYQGATNETAAQIIAKVSQACKINPQVLLVTLQKEQGLITASSGKSANAYNKALGFGCPDTGPCDPTTLGFSIQVYMAARQFQRYAATSSQWNHRPGVTTNILYNPDKACGSSPVLIKNQATASLYNYTPYQPNAAALAAGYGTGDSCSSYGNRNFWNYFTDWFGSTDQRNPIGTVDAVTSTSPGSLTVRGWALDPDTTASIRVHVYVDGKAVQSVLADRSRPDVGTAYGKGSAHGYAVTLPAATGTRQVCVYAIDATGGGNPKLGCKSVTVVNQAPIGRLDKVTSPSPTVISLSGWALDPDTTASIQVQVYVDGKAATSLTAKATRADVGKAYGKGSAHGFSTTLTAKAGKHEVCLYGIDSSGGTNPKLGCKTVTVTNTRPIGRLDSATSVEGRLQVKGWVLDPDTTDSIYAHVYVDGKLKKSVRATATRADVDRAYGKGAAHGFATTVALPAGDHEVCLYAIDSVGGANPKIACRTVTIVNQDPVGGIESTTTGDGAFTVQGWATDPDTAGAITAELYVDGELATSLVADAARADAADAGASGFTATIPAATGEHEVCLHGVDSWAGTSARIVCGTAVANGRPFGRLDTATSAVAGQIAVAGWAIDPNTTDPIRVHVYLDGVAKLNVLADVARSDVDRAYGMGTRHGYKTTLTGVAAGTHTVCTYAIDSFGSALGGKNPQLGCTSVTVR